MYAVANKSEASVDMLMDMPDIDLNKQIKVRSALYLYSRDGINRIDVDEVMISPMVNLLCNLLCHWALFVFHRVA